ncbi:hypothetical protein M8C21_005235 [Ambrosia artemisiifolia]|uniref:RRM domain-containing protein n=1 Tax=Ambrosia artemisiifolia TaxID=4212 RepID=A0AAD5GG42_AMBAR|nr:hypothetical protein M8C21_005235 [Ambrosia artemisiifolia]
MRVGLLLQHTIHLSSNFKPLSLSLPPSSILGLLLKMSRVYVGNLDPRVTDREIEDEFRAFGVIRK